MDIEQLKLILEAAGAAGDGAKEIAYIYVGYKVLDIVAALALTGIVAYTIFVTIKMVAGMISISERIKTAAGFAGDWTRNEVQDALRYVEAGKNLYNLWGAHVDPNRDRYSWSDKRDPVNLQMVIDHFAEIRARELIAERAKAIRLAEAEAEAETNKVPSNDG